jgi:hypothetical protein
MEITFESIFQTKQWNEIRDCPGRFIIKKKNGNCSELGPTDFIYYLTSIQTVSVEVFPNQIEKKDRVFLVPFPDGGGLLSYLKQDGTYVHTLNTPSGFERKLTALGILFEKSEKGIQVQNPNNKSPLI